VTESAAAWYARVRRALDDHGYRPTDWEHWSSWPFAGPLVPRELDPPAAAEPDRRGTGGRDCSACIEAADPGSVELALWWDEYAMLLLPGHGTSLPFAAFLLPRRHADLADLTPDEAARMGVLLAAVERAVIETLDVPRIQSLRWGDGGEHLHWWLLGRPTGALQLRGTFLSHWDDILPPAPAEITRAAGRAVAGRLVELVGGAVSAR
jgi:diadenosine tetraphosphate (Ap4A) HIT family hydrolase